MRRSSPVLGIGLAVVRSQTVEVEKVLSGQPPRHWQSMPDRRRAACSRILPLWIGWATLAEVRTIDEQRPLLVKLLDITPNTHPVSDFLAWQRDGTLNLKPEFQRRSVWKPGARSYLIDTIVRGLPVPLIFVRERLDLRSQRTVRDIVDGQQRLRTVFAFIDESTLEDLDPDRDRFTVKRAHSKELADRRFDELDESFQRRILGYKFSVQTLPPEVDDRDVLQIFARLNSTGLALNFQELRNAAYFGVFKTQMYSLAYEQLERWQGWNIFTGDQLSRMQEVEFTSDLTLTALRGLSGKSKAKIDSLYKDFDDSFPGEAEFARRFRKVMDTIDDHVGPIIPGSIFDREMHFFSLFSYVYDRMWGLASPLRKTSTSAVPSSLRARALELSKRFKEQQVPDKVLDSVARASTDLGRRRTRFQYSAGVLDGKARS